MEHVCTLQKEQSATDTTKWHVKCRLISPDNPLRVKYFRSDMAVRQEQKRQLEVDECTVHPFSKLRARYEMYLIFLYTSLIITKPFDSAFLQVDEPGYNAYKSYSLFTDFLGGLDIIISCFCGYEVPRNKTTELRKSAIIKHYMLGPYFIIDVLSTINKQTSKFGPKRFHRYIIGVVAILNMLKIVRLVTLVKYIRKTADYYRMSSRGKLFLICSIFVSLMIVHYMACLQFGIPRYIRRQFTAQQSNASWFFGRGERGNIFWQSMETQYIHCFFRSSAYILGIRLHFYAINLPEEYLLAVVTYFVGKILIAFIWIILAVAILNSRLVDIKYKEMFNQLEEYMAQKQMPMSLRKRIEQFFLFKFQHKYFKEELITSLLSEDLKKEANMHICKSLIKKVPIFSELNETEMSKVLNYLTEEIYLPHDIIIRSATSAHSMYFISSGTVAVYTHSGREVGHLQDGAYFGEIPLVMKSRPRLVTVKALEETQIYKLRRRDVGKCLLVNSIVRQKIMKQAEERFLKITLMEEEYQTILKQQFVRDATNISVD